MPEIEALRRSLDEPVARAPVEARGPAHIATLKTFDPPLDRARGPELRGRAPAREAPALPHGGRRARPARPPDVRGPRPLPRSRRARVRRRPRSGCDSRTAAARPHRGRQEEAREGRALHAGGDRGRARAPRARRARHRSRSGSARSSRGTSGRLHPLPPRPAGVAGIGRAWANEILHRAKLSPYALSKDLSDEEVERLSTTIRELMA